MHERLTKLTAICLSSFLVSCADNAATDEAPTEEARSQAVEASSTLAIRSLADLTVDALRARSYSSVVQLEKQIGDQSGGNEYADSYSATGGAYDTFMASYDSDGLRLYTRIDIPNTPMPEDGYPVVIFCHGWVGINDAPTFHFSYTPKSMYAEMIDGYVDAGFVVLTPGYRGHGEVDGVQADGIEYMATWDNATYVSPIYYAIDVLNLLDGLQSVEQADFAQFPNSAVDEVRLDLARVSLSGHSQGGDVVLHALAIAGEGSEVKTAIAAASISDGTFPDRFVQLETYGPMQATPEAFMSGDGTWTGTAIGADGSENPDFVFGWPPDWIGVVNRDEWTWQNDTWSTPTVVEAIAPRYEQMYATLNALVDDISGAGFEIVENEEGGYSVIHDSGVQTAMASLGAFQKERYLSEPLILHYSDQDFYSIPAWNIDLCERVNRTGGACRDFLYPANTHLMRVSEHDWFSPAGSVQSYDYIVRRDVAHFSGDDAASIAYP